MREESRKIRRELLKTMVSLATAGFGFVAALAWNEAIQAIIKKFIPDASGALSKFIYAVIVTGIAVFITYTLGKMTGEIEKEDNKK